MESDSLNRRPFLGFVVHFVAAAVFLFFHLTNSWLGWLQRTSTQPKPKHLVVSHSVCLIHVLTLFHTYTRIQTQLLIHQKRMLLLCFLLCNVNPSKQAMFVRARLTTMLWLWLCTDGNSMVYFYVCAIIDRYASIHYTHAHTQCSVCKDAKLQTRPKKTHN